MHALTIAVSNYELLDLKRGNTPPAISTRLTEQALKIAPSNAIEVIASAGAMALHYKGKCLGHARKYHREGREYWQIALAPDYNKRIRRNALPRLVDAVQRYADKDR